MIKKGISIFAAPSNIRGKGSILRYGTFIRKAKIPQKYLDKLRAKYKNFQLTEFSEYGFERKYIYQFVIFKPLSYCFEETIGFDVLSRLQVVQYRV